MEPATQPLASADTQQLITLTQLFRTRAHHLRLQSYGVLALIMVMLAAAIWIFFSAADITKQDVAVKDVFRRSDDVKAQIDKLTKELPPEPKLAPSANDEQKYRELVSVWRTNCGAVVKIILDINSSISEWVVASKSREFLDRAPVEYETIIPEWLEYAVYESLKTKSSTHVTGPVFQTDSLLRLKAELRKDQVPAMLASGARACRDAAKQADDYHRTTRASFDRELEAWRTQTKDAREKLTDYEEGFRILSKREREERFGGPPRTDQAINVSMPFLLQTNITRFGPMIIILFFVSILVNLYRYCIRLAGYYDARADALGLVVGPINISTLEKLVATFSPDQHDLGKPPRLPTEYAIDIAKATIDKAVPKGK